MTSSRRMGSVDSEKAESMLDAAETILRDEGYAALTSRRVADMLGIKQRLVYYYFQTMEDLMLATFKRLSGRELRRIRAAAKSERPLHEVWRICMDTSDARLVSEFMALANRSDGIRAEVIKFVETSRKIQIDVWKKAIAENKIELKLTSPEVIAIIGASVALTLNRESSLGVKCGHAALSKEINNFFSSVENAIDLPA